MVAEYRHEDAEGKYYLDKVIMLWMAGFKAGALLGIIPFLVYWILR